MGKICLFFLKPRIIYTDFARMINTIVLEKEKTDRAITEAIKIRFLSDHAIELFTAMTNPSTLTIEEAILATNVTGRR